MPLICPRCGSDNTVVGVRGCDDYVCVNYNCQYRGNQSEFKSTVIFQSPVNPSQISLLEQKIEYLENTIKKLGIDLHDKIENNEKSNVMITDRIKNLEIRIYQQENKIKNLENENEVLRNKMRDTESANQKPSPFGERPWTFVDKLKWSQADHYFESEINNQSILGQWILAQFPSQYKILQMKAIRNDLLKDSLECFMKTVELRRGMQGPFNPTVAMTPEKLCVINDLLSRFNPRGQYKKVNTLYVWHGCKIGNEVKIAGSGFATLSTEDEGFFGLGKYVTPNVEYAIRYATGELSVNGPTTSPWCVILSCCAVGMAYPVTRDVDYPNPIQCERFGKPIKSGYDCHYVPVSETFGFHACPISVGPPQYFELVASHDSQLLPLAIVWFTH